MTTTSQNGATPTSASAKVVVAPTCGSTLTGAPQPTVLSRLCDSVGLRAAAARVGAFAPPPFASLFWRRAKVGVAGLCVSGLFGAPQPTVLSRLCDSVALRASAARVGTVAP